MIKLIKNEMTKIFKKKSLYITLLVALAFVILSNCMYKYSNNRGINEYSDNYVKYLQEEMKHLDPNKASDVTAYIENKTMLDVIELSKKYEANSWQSSIIQSKLRAYLQEINTYKYGLEKNEEALKNAEEKYQAILEKLDRDDWKYFAQTELQDVKEQIEQQEKQKQQIVDKTQIEQIENNLYDLNLQKQVIDWRLEKDISYAQGPLNDSLSTYYNSQMAIHQQEQTTSEDYQAKIEYQRHKERASISKYAVENNQAEEGEQNSKSIFMDFFDNYELFIIVIIVMIAGAIVSEEFNKGTVKLLLVRPYSRGKILAAKFITCMITILLAIVSIAIMQLIVGGIVFGFGSLASSAVVFNFTTNAVQTMNVFTYFAITAVAKLPLYILIATIAFALSTIFTNTPLAIVISLLGYMSTSIINAMAIQFNIQFLKFFITLNWDLTQYLFGKLASFQYVNFGFSLIICLAYLIIMLVPTFILFKKKNIKNV